MPRVLNNKGKTLEKLTESIAMLEDIYRGLSEYLEAKRFFFPRFFFMSNDELIEILSETSDPHRVEPYLKKCFEGIKKLTFDDATVVLAMQSAEGEVVMFSEPIRPLDANGLVEKWLKQVEEVMKASLRIESLKALEAYENTERNEWIVAYPGQIVLAVNCVCWTNQVTLVCVICSFTSHFVMLNNTKNNNNQRPLHRTVCHSIWRRAIGGWTSSS